MRNWIVNMKVHRRLSMRRRRIKRYDVQITIHKERERERERIEMRDDVLCKDVLWDSD